MIPPKLLSVKNFSLTAYLGQLLEKGRTHKLKKFLCATIFGGFWIEWKQKQKGVVFFTKSCGPALDPPPLMLWCAPPKTTTITFNVSTD